MDTTMKWFSMPVGVQISNVGSEVHRALTWKKRGNQQRAAEFCKKAISFLDIMMRSFEENKNFTLYNYHALR